MKNKTFRNLYIGIILQLITAICGIAVPKLILQYYGSSINGLIVSISQLISYLALVEGGIGAVAIVALYSPLVDQDSNKINNILSATSLLYKKTGLIYLCLVFVIGIVYPFFVMGQIDPILVTTLFYILSVSNLVDYLFLGKYKVLLSADERLYIINLSQIFALIFNTLFSIILIINNADIILVKSISIIVCLIRLIVIKSYCNTKYSYLSFKEKPDYKPLSERWDSLVHQITAIVVGNTDVFLITVLMGTRSLLEVSVYSVYNMVFVALSGIFGTLSSSLQAYFGKQISALSNNLTNRFILFESLFYPFLFMIFCCAASLILPFVNLYTEGITDINYYRPLVAMVFVFNAVIQNIRIPGITLICAAGKFKETRNRAILEAVINLTVSIILIPKFGILGALIGTSCSYLYRTIDVLIYSHSLITDYSIFFTVKLLFINSVLFCVVYFVNTIINSQLILNCWFNWIIAGFFNVCVGLIIFSIFNILLNRYLKSTLSRKRG